VLRRCIFLFSLISCGTSQGTLEITTGGEADVFTKDPKPTQLVVETFGTDGSSTRIGQAALPVTTLDLVEQKKTAVATIRVTARDAAGTILATGSSLLLELGVLSDHTLQIFIQRNGELARMPQVLGDAREDPTLAVLGGRYVFVVGGGLGVKTQLYDLMSLVALVNPPDMPFVPKSVAPLDIGELLISDTEGKIYDFSKSGSDAVKPASLDEGSWGEIAAGRRSRARQVRSTSSDPRERAVRPRTKSSRSSPTARRKPGRSVSRASEPRHASPQVAGS